MVWKTTIKNNMITLGTIAAITAASIMPSYAAIEINETDFGPSYETMAVDTVVGKPLQLVAAVAGTAAYIVSLPFSIAGGNAEQAQQKMVVEPWEALQRCLGCTVAEDNYYKSQASNQGLVRIVVDQPSEILISTNDQVIVTPQ
ncbi:MAG: hypothetical protein Q4P13_06415 [Psychrobacter sp.]|nr:hypothetical protein [Psychrobacter sp.]